MRSNRQWLFRSIRKNGTVWGDGITQNVIWYVVKGCAARVGIKALAPHDLRRTCARLYHAAGGELEQIQFLMGHASVQTDTSDASRIWPGQLTIGSRLRSVGPEAAGAHRFLEGGFAPPIPLLSAASLSIRAADSSDRMSVVRPVLGPQLTSQLFGNSRRHICDRPDSDPSNAIFGRGRDCTTRTGDVQIKPENSQA